MADPTATAAAPARITVPHDRSLELDYHEWVSTRDRIKVDRIGRSNPRMVFTNATLWVCNNPQCCAQAVVPDAAITTLIEAEEDQLDQILSHR